MGLFHKAAVVCVSLVWLTQAVAQTETTRERKALSRRAANQMVQRDLLSVLEPAGKIGSGMLRQLRSVGMQTRAFGTEVPGVCRRDSLYLLYAPTERGESPEDVPLRPYGIEAQSWFHIIKLPRAERRDARDRTDIWQADCDAAGRRDGANWFAASDAHTAAQGVLVLDAAVEAIRSGSLKADPCPSIFDAGKSTCEAVILAEGDVSKIDHIDVCPSEEGAICYAVTLGVTTTISVKATVQEDVLAPSRILSVSVAQYIVVT